MKQRIRKIPKGWRILTPSEKIDATCMHNLKSHDMFIKDSHVQEQFALGNPECNGYIKTTVLWFGTKTSEHPSFILIKPKTQLKSVTLTPQISPLVGTQAANGVSSEAPV